MPLASLSSDSIKKFAESHKTIEVMPIRMGRFVVPIPNLDDGEGPLELPNAKELRAIIKSGDLGNVITAAELEGIPQIVPADGTDAVVINGVSPFEARMIQHVYDYIAQKNGGLMDRKSLIEFFQKATGIAFDPENNTVRLVQDSIGIRGDVYNMSREIFKGRHSPYGTEMDMSAMANDEIEIGHYQKKRQPFQAFAIKGGFTRETESGGDQVFQETAMVVIGKDGVVSAVHRNDINSSYETPKGEKLVSDSGDIALPTYPVGQILLESRGAPPRTGYLERN